MGRSKKAKLFDFLARMRAEARAKPDKDHFFVGCGAGTLARESVKRV
jgi:hypothetical protein